MIKFLPVCLICLVSINAMAKTGKQVPSLKLNNPDNVLAKTTGCPTPDTIIGATTVCGGDTQTYSVAPIAGATSYVWTLPDGWAGTSDSDSITVVTGGESGVITVYVEGNCGSGTPQSLSINNTAATASIVANGDTVICQSGGSVSLSTATTDAAYTYQWKRNDTAISGATDTFYIATQPGSYTLSITNASGCIGSSNAIGVSIFTIPGNIIFSYPSPPLLCAGSFAMMNTAYEADYSYEWLLNGSPVFLGNEYGLETSEPGEYSVVITAPNGCTDTSAPLLLTVIPSPSVPVVSNSGPICFGDSVTLSATNIDSGTSILWTNEGDMAVADSVAVVSPNDLYFGENDFFFIVTDTDGCTSAATAAVMVIDPPGLYGTITGDTSICPESNQMYSISSGAVDTFFWTIPTGWSGSSITGQINVTTDNQGGIISVYGINHCGITDTQTLDVTVQTPPGIIITQNGQSLHAPINFDTFQWYRDSVAIPGATTSVYTPTQDGGYYVRVLPLTGGCYRESNTITIDLGLPIVRSGIASLSLYPNPNTGSFILAGDISVTEGKVNIDVLDVTGRVVLNTQAAVANNMIDKQITLGSDVAAGIYMVHIYSGSVNGVMQFVKK